MRKKIISITKFTTYIPFLILTTNFLQLTYTIETNTKKKSSIDFQSTNATGSIQPNRALNGGIAEVIASAVNNLKSLIDSNPSLGPKFIRLSFHDCVGGCDGCVDLSTPDNNGLDIPINALSSIVDMHTTSYYTGHNGLTRADIWALAAITGANYANPNSDDYFHFNYYGRTNCEDSGQPCLGPLGQNLGCSSTTGPHRIMPAVNADTEDLLDFFNDEFEFSDQQTVALLGVHTVGVASQSNSGFKGPAGWTKNNHILNNGYYKELSGAADALVDDAPNWRQTKVTNALGVQDRYQWRRETGNGKELMMLNSDISLARSFGNNLNKNTGEVSCNFKDSNVCDTSKTLAQVAIYRDSNTQWLHDFRSVFQKMLVHGYSQVGCSGPTCLYQAPIHNLNENCRGKQSKYLKILLESWVDTAILS